VSSPSLVLSSGVVPVKFGARKPDSGEVSPPSMAATAPEFYSGRPELPNPPWPSDLKSKARIRTYPFAVKFAKRTL